jgi:DDE superfamily endonuclease
LAGPMCMGSASAWSQAILLTDLLTTGLDDLGLGWSEQPRDQDRCGWADWGAGPAREAAAAGRADVQSGDEAGACGPVAADQHDVRVSVAAAVANWRRWGRRGHTPVVSVSGKGSGRVSVAGLVCLKAEARSHLFYRMRVHRGRKGERRSMPEADYAGLITAAHHQLQDPLIVIWDNLNTHVSAVMSEFTGTHPDWLTVIQLPAYAPELNAAEMSLPQCELRRSALPWLSGSLSFEVSIGLASSVQRRRLW